MVIPCLCSFRFSSCTAHHKTAVIPIDIPRRWEPRTNQSPTGALIAFAALGTCCSRPVPPTTNKKSSDESLRIFVVEHCQQQSNL